MFLLIINESELSLSLPLLLFLKLYLPSGSELHFEYYEYLDLISFLKQDLT